MSATSDAPAAPPSPAGGSRPGSRLRARLARVPREAWVGWGGVALGVIAFYITLPPVLVRSLAPSLLIAVVGLVLGVVAIRAGQKRVGWGAVVACVAGAFGAYGAIESGVTNLERVVVWSALLAAALRYATPITFAALGGVTSERSGVVNIGLEGMMLMGAFFGAWGADVTGTWVGGILIGLAAGGVTGLLHAVFAVSLRADQIVSGTAINFLALGVTGFLYVKIYGEQGTPDDLPEIPDVHLPIGWIPFLGDALEQTNLLVWLGLILVAVVSIVLFRTPTGLGQGLGVPGLKLGDQIRVPCEAGLAVKGAGQRSADEVGNSQIFQGAGHERGDGEWIHEVSAV